MNRLFVLTASCGVAMTMASSAAVGDSRLLADNWNTAACDQTDRAILTLAQATHVDRVDLWFHWNQGEQSVAFKLVRDGRAQVEGALARGECDPYQAAWCAATVEPQADLEAGSYTFVVQRAAVCVNGGIGGGFLRATGAPN